MLSSLSSLSVPSFLALISLLFFQLLSFSFPLWDLLQSLHFFLSLYRFLVLFLWQFLFSLGHGFTDSNWKSKEFFRPDSNWRSKEVVSSIIIQFTKVILANTFALAAKKSGPCTRLYVHMCECVLTQNRRMHSQLAFFLDVHMSDELLASPPLIA